MTAAGGNAAVVVLPTGDRFRVGVGGGGETGLAMDQAPGASDAFANFQVGGDQYVIPSEAAPYAGRQLDLSLFDVTKLAAAPPDPAAHIPVQLTFAAGVTPAAPAGVTFTSVSGQNATGYLTPDSGKAFAQALRDAVKADLAAGKPAGTGALFGGLTSMAVLGTTAPVQPDYPLHILQLNTLDGTGAPSNSTVLLLNTDNAHEFAAPVVSNHGVVRVAVPAGNYAAFSFDTIYNSQFNTVRLNLFSLDGITVPATGTVPTVATLDERTASSPVAFTTGKPASQAVESAQIVRRDANGVDVWLKVFGGTGTIYVSPEAKPAIGSLNYTVNWVGTSPATAASQYQYNLVETSDHIDANQSYAPADSSLATLRHTLNLDPAYGSNPLFGFGSAFISPYGSSLWPLTESGDEVTQYVTGGLQWVSQLSLPWASGNSRLANVVDDPALYTAGQIAARTWAYAPEAPNFGHHAAAPDPAGCRACVGAGNMNVTLGTLGDSHPDTYGVEFGVSGTSQLYWNGQLVSSGPGQNGYLLRNVPSGPATVRAVFDYDYTGDGVTQSTKTHTDVTIPYSGETDPSLALPSAVACVAADLSSTPNAPCQILPALSLNYQLLALDKQNTSHSPVQALVLNVGHISYGDFGSHAAIDSAKVSVSYDNGATWQDAPAYGFDGIYAAHWANPKAGSPVELKVTATDCLGGSITQTITDPYTVGATS